MGLFESIGVNSRDHLTKECWQAETVRARARSGRENDRRARVSTSQAIKRMTRNEVKETRMEWMNFEEESTFLLQEVQRNLTLLRLSQD
jgi:hypothetical protein